MGSVTGKHFINNSHCLCKLHGMQRMFYLFLTNFLYFKETTGITFFFLTCSCFLIIPVNVFIDLQVSLFFLVRVKYPVIRKSNLVCSGSDVSLSVIKILQMEIMFVHALE